MGRRANWPPRVTHHKASGQDRVRFRGHDYYLGETGSVASRKAYLRLLAELEPGKPLTPVDTSSVITMGKICAEWGPHALRKYGPANRECQCYEEALRPLLALYADLPAASIGDD